MSDYLDPNNEELLKDFFSEAQMQVDTLEQNILVLENEGGNKDAVDEIFRAAHTLKGGSATVEMMELSHFTHMVEDVLDAIRSDQLAVNEDVVDTLLAAIDIIKAMLGQRMEGAIYQADTSEMEGRLEALIPESSKGKKGGAVKAKPPAAAAPAPAAAAVAAPAAPAGGLSEDDLRELRESVDGGMPIFRISVVFDESSLMNTVGGIQVYAALKGDGTVLRTIPDFEQLYEDNFYPTVEYYVASNKTPEDLKKHVLIPDVSLSAIVTDVSKPAAEAAPAPAAAPAPVAAPAAPAPAAAPAEAAAPAAKSAAATAAAGEDAKKAGKEAGSILRVDSKRIDDLLNLVSETVITKATFNQISNQFGDLVNDLHSIEGAYREKIKNLFDRLPDYLEGIQEGRSIKDVRKEINEEYGDIFALFDGFEASLKNNMGKFRSTSQNLGRITGELQEGVMRIRMVPISQIFSRFPRLVRDLSKSLNKKINLVIEGEETELDKSVIEDLLDPIMHSVRNSIDHGIESQEERKASGKPEEGMVLLKATNEGNMIVIEISDDGKGIDVEAVKGKAVERGLISPNKLLTDPEAFNLIFEPGFSTAKTITSISGRGVGLDVVRRSIEKLNGTVTVTSEKGKGTTFLIKLPLTLAIIQGLLVRVGGEIYSIPITSVIESLRIKPEEIRMIDNYEVFNIRNDVISLLRLNRLFGIHTEEQQDYNFIVIVGTAEKKMGFMVDSLIGEEDVVIKPLRDQFTNSPGIAGASILGDGSVSLIIDVSQLLELGLHQELEARRVRELSNR
ncbi:chemotaxis protein CheA [Treponema primitia ZAS-2]|uniref:Chemotaxis protein CheA n=1 Tax=Treponema primitia (strain ATCC BAA-887 / DSM 12427 / ZAS-2) TaxID=545694 RepID=F5YNL1_TREPZ|nr:chemotaxis protein CheA [Treponema primitia]AEF86080.1 chemotaxis protein CheA [Treponema primitia ZAS-2]